MTINTTPTIPTAVDQRADLFIDQFAERIAPVQHYTKHVYGEPFAKLSTEHKLATIAVVHHAVEYGAFPTDFMHRRAALEALDLARRELTAEDVPSDYRAVYAGMIGKLARNVAATYVEL